MLMGMYIKWLYNVRPEGPQKNNVPGEGPEDSPLAKDLITAVMTETLALLKEGSPLQVRADGRRYSHRYC